MADSVTNPVMTREQCNVVYVDMLDAHARLKDHMPYEDQQRQYERLVGMLSAIRIIRGDQLDADLMVDIVKADIRAHARGAAPALNVHWI